MRNFQGIFFDMNTNIKRDFQICISVPLMVNFIFCAVNVAGSLKGES